MRNISFSMTLESFKDGSKDVTRRIGWDNLKPGDHLMAVEKAQGLKKGEHVKKIGEIEIISNVPEQLRCIEYSPQRVDDLNWKNKNNVDPLWGAMRSEMRREGFPLLSPQGFANLFIKFNPVNPKTKERTTRTTTVNRIVFKRV